MQKTKQTYNGWANWQTWNVALWLGNDEGLYRAYNEAREMQPRKRFNSATAEDFVREMMPKGTPDMNAASGYRGVRWGAIARMMNER